MPVEPVLILLLVAVAVAAILLLTAAIVVWTRPRRQEPRAANSRLPAIRPEMALVPAPRGVMQADAGPPAVSVDGVPTAVYDRVLRVVSWMAILGATAFVAVSGLWTSTQSGVLVVLALAGFMVLVVHDIVPPSTLGNVKYILEGCVGITLVTLIIVMTGQEFSPFFLAYPIIVAGAALVAPIAVTIVLAALASAEYVVAVTFGRQAVLDQRLLPNIGINIVALVLLAFVASFIAREQRRSRQAAIRLSTVDTLTGLFNRGFFFTTVEREIQRSTRTGRRFGLLMMDLDGLKAINDRYGHHRGDEVLRAVAAVIRTGVRRIDTAARYGGDEFVVLLPETEPTGAYILAEKIRQGVEELELTGPGFMIQTSMSIGAVAYPDDGMTADELLISADRAMYVSKRQGKNRVVGYTTAGVSGPEDGF